MAWLTPGARSLTLQRSPRRQQPVCTIPLLLRRVGFEQQVAFGHVLRSQLSSETCANVMRSPSSATPTRSTVRAYWLDENLAALRAGTCQLLLADR